jgi:hypothetical protein
MFKNKPLFLRKITEESLISDIYQQETVVLAKENLKK